MALTKDDLQAIAQVTKDIVKGELEPINTRLDSLDSGIKATNTRLEATNTRLEATNTRLDTLFADQKSMQAAIMTVQTDVSELKQGQAVMQIQLHRLESKADEGFKDTQDVVAEVAEVVGNEIQILKKA